MVERSARRAQSRTTRRVTSSARHERTVPRPRRGQGGMSQIRRKGSASGMGASPGLTGALQAAVGRSLDTAVACEYLGTSALWSRDVSCARNRVHRDNRATAAHPPGQGQGASVPSGFRAKATHWLDRGRLAGHWMGRCSTPRRRPVHPGRGERRHGCAFVRFRAGLGDVGCALRAVHRPAAAVGRGAALFMGVGGLVLVAFGPRCRRCSTGRGPRSCWRW